jgi:hypothetical protein
MNRTIVLLSLAAASCGTQSAPPPAAPIAAGVQTRCIDLQQVIARHAQPPSSILFEMSGGVTYRNDLVGGCPGVARATGSEIVQTESQSTTLCANDTVRVYDPVEAKATGAGSFAQCRLGVFTADRR